MKVYLSIKYSDIQLMLFRVQKDFAWQIFKKKLSKQLLIIEDCINDYGDKQYLIEK